MNALINYTSDSESENEASCPPISKGQLVVQRRQPIIDTPMDDDDFVSAALKDLESFADTAGEVSREKASRHTADDASQAGVNEEPDDFLSFLKEIDSIPFPPEDHDQDQDQEQEDPPPPPPPESPPSLYHVEPPPPPPPPPPQLPTSALLDSDGLLQLSSGIGNLAEITSQEIHVVKNRLYHLSLLPTLSIDQKDLERRLLEFTTRIMDWEKGGLYDSYFLGQERATIIEAGYDPDEISSIEQLPQYDGVVGSMIKHMYKLEEMVVSPEWVAVWDAEDEAYGFQHLRTGTYSPVYPSEELIHQLDPPSQATSLPVRSTSRSLYSSRSSRNYASGLPMGTTTVTPSPIDIQSSMDQSSTSKSMVKVKKRKTETTEDPDFMDPHIHPSRKAALTVKSGGSSQSSKTMPKKLANMLQKWSEKDMEVDDKEEEEEEETGQEMNLTSSMTGSNSLSLGGDWRSRRMQPR
ncbi:hypothetical protein BGZ76_006372 [Entomortierella beljakovae]|nr:hypothetical protein BGZ76_006372 [Entomortierella beljakovae]